MKLLKITTTGIVASSLPVNLLLDFGYSFFSLEVLGTAACLAIAGAAIGAMTARSFAYAYFLAVLIYLFTEIYFFNWGLVQALISITGLFLLIFTLRKTGIKLLPYILVFAAFFSISAMFKPQPSMLLTTNSGQFSVTNQTQSLLHIVLDELASPYASAFPPAPGHPAETMLEELFMQGFQVKAQAFSIDTLTVRSLSALVALDPLHTEFNTFRPGSIIANAVTNNNYMKTLSGLGYNAKIIQSNYLDYCSELKNVLCQTYSRVGHVDSLSSAPISERLKIAFLTINESMKSNTRAGVMPYAIIMSMIEGRRPVLDAYVPLISHELMQGMVLKQVESIRPGEVYYIHLLLPHFPYVYDANCEQRRINDWGYPDRHSAEQNTARSYAKYWDQVACVKNVLSKILSATAEKDFLTTIVHGDHGARVLWLTDNETFDDNRKTFVAARSSVLEPGIHLEPVELQTSVINILESFINRSRTLADPISVEVSQTN